MRLTAIDPGGTTGWAQYRNQEIVSVGTLPFGDELWEWIAHERPNLFVVEDYIVRPAHIQSGFAHQWNKGEALQVIGAIKCHAFNSGIPVVLQQPSIKPMAAKLTNIEYKKGKRGNLVHVQDAMLHAIYYMNTHKDEYGPQESSASSSG